MLATAFLSSNGGYRFPRVGVGVWWVFFITTGWGSAAGSQCIMTLPHCQQLLYY